MSEIMEEANPALHNALKKHRSTDFTGTSQTSLLTVKEETNLIDEQKTKLDIIYQLVSAHTVDMDNELDDISLNTNKKILGGFLMIRLVEDNLIELQKAREVS